MSGYIVTSAEPAAAKPSLTQLSHGGWCCAVGGAIAAAGAIVTSVVHTAVPSTRESYPWTPGTAQILQLVWTACSALVLVGVIALARSGLAGHSPLARAGVAITVVSMALLVPAQASFVFVAHAATSSSASSALGAIATIIAVVAAVGFTLTGIATLQAGRWRRPGRYLPLACGLFVLLVMLPVVAVDPDVLFWPIAGWNLCLAALGLALVDADRKEAAAS
jgi:hypothetical protein